MRAHQIMTRKVVSVMPEQSVFQAANLMLRNHVSGLPVVDEKGAIVGIVSEGDFLRPDGQFKLLQVWSVKFLHP